MSITSYAELQTAIGNWLARDDLTIRIPEFITLAEAKLNRQLRCQDSEVRAITTINLLSAEPEFISLPLDFQMMKSLRLQSVTGKPRVQFLAQEQLDDYRTSINDQVGRPLYFTVFGIELELAPTPDDSYVLEMIYRSVLPALSATNTSNWLLEVAPDAYLYGALLEAAPYMRDNDQLQVWGSAFQATIEALNQQTQEAKYSAGPLAITVDGATP